MTHAPNVAPEALPTLTLRRREERRILAGHMWVFSNEVDTNKTPFSGFSPGDLCRLESSRGELLGIAYVNPRALICARLLTRSGGAFDATACIETRLREALGLRERLYPNPWYRLVHGESDRLPGLVLERYGDIVVGQVGTAGMERLMPVVEAAVAEVLAPAGMLWKNDSGARRFEDLEAYVRVAFGEVPDEVALEESGVRFRVPIREGQKTGWFYDQARNRQSLLSHVNGRSVLDVFCYLGAWGLTAAKAGASEVTCVDASSRALAAVAETAEENDLEVSCIEGDAFAVLEGLRDDGRTFDVVVIDPPAFIKRKKDIAKGEAAYRRLNQLAAALVAPEGLLVSCSCSYHLEANALVGAIQRGARRTGRFAQIIEDGVQAPDHPVHPGINETRYLKGYTARLLFE